MTSYTDTAGGRLFARPRSQTGVWSWITTVDHKRIGILYGITAFAFFIVGGFEALLIRLQLARPDGKILSAETYNQLFTMHGLTMIFLVVMPLSAAFFNYLVPIMLGARDVAFPRLNAFSYWVFLFGGIFMYSSFIIKAAPNGGWFGYAPLSVQGAAAASGVPPTGSEVFAHNMTFYALGLLILGIASTVSAINLAVTIINMRAPGMSFFRMPVFVWMAFVVQLLLIFALPVVTVALFLLLFDRTLGTSFYVKGGDPILWQHLFWLFAHPEVYILILPAMGIVSEIIPVFSRKPLFGYQVMVFSGIAIGFMSWGVWAHHMFAVGLGPVANSAFAVSTMFIAVPTGVKIFNWLATMWGGRLRFEPPMLFAIGFVAMFTIGGLSGVTHSIVPHDYQQTDTYYVVAHFHYVLFGGAIFGLFGGIYYWWPKVYGWMLNSKIGKVQFWLMLLGFNLTFAPFHILGLQGQPRRTYTYPKGYGWDTWNFVATIGAFTIALSVLLFLYNVIVSKRQHVVAGNDPWDARTLEWTIPSPPPEYNFAEIPLVHSLDDFWHRKYAEDRSGALIPVPSGAQESGDEGEIERTKPETPAPIIHETGDHAARPEHSAAGHGIHMPTSSYMPILASLGFPIIGYGLIWGWYISAVGGLILLAGLFGWVNEPATE